MATCSYGDSFYIDADWTYDDLGTMDGCYEVSAYTYNSLPLYFRDGDMVDEGQVVFASTFFGTTVS